MLADDYTAARLSGLEVGPFFVANALMLLFAALLTTWALERMGARTISCSQLRQRSHSMAP